MNQFVATWEQWSRTNRRGLRWFRHVMIWLLVWLVSAAFILHIVQERPLVKAGLTLLIAVSTLGYYYLFGYFIFPRFLYRFRPAGLLGWIVLIFWLSYVLNRYIFLSLEPYGLPDAYLHRVGNMLRPAGLLGCFTSIRLTLWNYVLGLYLATILLLLKAAKDTTAYRNQRIRLERNKLRLERDRLVLERNHLVLELDFLKMQISPHFLFNALNSIYARVVDADEQAADQVLRLAELMRYNLYEASAERIALEHELTYINDYLQLEKARHAEWISVAMDTDDRVSHYQIAPLLLSTFVENAFKHGVRAGKSAYVYITALMEADTLVFTVQNALQERSASSGRKSGGVGLVNVKKRLDLLYDNRYTLVAGPADDQYVVTLRLRLEPLPN